MTQIVKPGSISRNSRRAHVEEQSMGLAPIIFDLSLLNEPRARLAWARSHLAVVRDEEVLEEHRRNAAAEANRIAGRAGSALIPLRDHPSTPPAVRALATSLLAEVNTILRESFAALHPEEQSLAPVRWLLPRVSGSLRAEAANDAA